MKYQVSCSMSFNNQTDQDTVYNYLNGKMPLAMTEKGDYLRVENALDGTFKLECLFRFVEEGTREEVYGYLAEKKGLVDTDVPGFIEKHTCYHDEGGSCTDPVRESWGEVVGP